jgi:hypothetical protein
VPSYFLTHRGNGSIKTSGDGSECVTCSNAARNLFALTEAEHPWGAGALGWRNTAIGLQHAVKVGGSLAQCTADPEDRLARSSTPEFFALRAGNGRVTSYRHVEHLLS